ncbi:MAG TPA: cupredoxin domain-containing protein, partial [Thermopolyspora sp.]
SAAVPAVTQPDGSQLINIWVTGHGYRPAIVAARAGVPAHLVIHTSGTTGCLRTITLAGHDHVLPATGTTTIDLGGQGPSTLRFVCGMGMYQGFLEFHDTP